MPGLKNRLLNLNLKTRPTRPTKPEKNLQKRRLKPRRSHLLKNQQSPNWRPRQGELSSSMLPTSSLAMDTNQTPLNGLLRLTLINYLPPTTNGALQVTATATGALQATVNQAQALLFLLKPQLKFWSFSAPRPVKILTKDISTSPAPALLVEATPPIDLSKTR